MNWISIKDKEPVWDDIPFITYDKYGTFDVWEDTDWFQELSEKDRLEHTHWAKITKP